MTKQRKCLACGKIHQDEPCSIVAEKLGRCITSSNKNFLLGNIFLECIKTKNNFIQILNEISEELIETREFMSSHLILSKRVLMQSDLLTEYFAISLNCHSSQFFKKSSITSKEFGKLLENDWYMCDTDISFSNNGESIEYIEIPVSITGSNLNFCVRKEHECDKKWSYNLYLKISNPNFDIMFYGIYHGVSSDEILLLKEYKGEIKNYFEEEFDSIWSLDNLVIEYPYTDPLFDFWMTNLEKATKSGKLEWDKENENTYCTTYGKSDIKININLDSKYGNSELLYVRDGEGGTGLRFGNRCTDVYIELGKGDESTEVIEGVTNTERNDRILRLADVIEKVHSNRNDIINYNSLPLKKMEHSDVLIKTKSMICHNREHYITPVRGIVKLLNIDNSEINYEIYVGYCKSCNENYVFTRDYNEMLKVGTPLCTVYDNGKEGHKKFTEFKFKSQSVLNAMGYSVDATSDLSKEERQSILKEALDKQLVTTHDLLSFLNWLIKTRETQVRMDQAVEKWKIDYKFVSEYQKEKRDIVKINSIHVN